MNNNTITPACEMSKIEIRSATKPSGQMILNAGFLLLFPGFFLYHTLLGLGHIRAFLGGYFSIISILLIGPLIWYYFRNIWSAERNISNIDIYFWLFLSYFLTIIIVNSMAGANPQIVRNHLLAIIYWIDVFIIFKTIDFGEKKIKFMLILCLASMSMIIFWFQIDGTFYLGILGLSADPDSVATYQGFSRTYLFTSLPVIAFSRRLSMRVVLYSVAIPTLYINSARSEFIALLMAIPIIEFYYSQHKIGFFFFSTVSAISFWASLNFISGVLPNNRTLELLDLSQSTSAILRHKLSNNAMRTIIENPILGEYASYLPGNYAHNMLSAWVDIGLFGMIYLFLMLIFIILKIFIYGFFKNKKNCQLILAFSLSCLTLMLLLMSHYFDDMMVAATLGAYSRYCVSCNIDRNCTPSN